MPKYEYHILCSSDQACGKVMEGMKKQKFTRVVKTPNVITSDHSAMISAVNADRAYIIAKELLKYYKDKIHDVTVIPQ